MTATDDRSPTPLKIVTAIGQEFEQVLDREGKGSKLRWASARHRRSTGALALVALLAVTGAAGAATGALPVGSVIPGDESSVRHSDHGTGPAETVLATGATPVAGPWRLTSYRSEGIVVDGEVAEAAGMPCVLLELTNAPEATHSRASSFCLAPGKPDFNMLSLPVVNSATGKSELVLYGFSPRGAAAVKLAGDDGQTIRVQTHDGLDAFPGSVWVMAVPSELKNAELVWINEDGRAADPKLDAGPHLARLQGR